MLYSFQEKKYSDSFETVVSNGKIAAKRRVEGGKRRKKVSFRKNIKGVCVCVCVLSFMNLARGMNKISPISFSG